MFVVEAILASLCILLLIALALSNKSYSPSETSQYSRMLIKGELFDSGLAGDIRVNLFTGMNNLGNPFMESIALSIRGASHVEKCVANQDSFCIFETEEFIFIVLSDGVSNSPNSHIGSQLLVTRAKRIIKERANSGSIRSNDFWLEVNQLLTKEMLSDYWSRVDLPDVDQLDEREFRTAAANYFAATLEVLAISRAVAGTRMSGQFTYIRLAGDGTLMLIDRGLGSVTNDFNSSNQAHFSKTSNVVTALPVCDDDPLIIHGEVDKGDALLFMTDGLGDHASGSKFLDLLKKSLGKELSAHNILRLGLSDKIQTSDDRTIAIVRMI